VNTILAQIYVQIRDDKTSPFVKHGIRPRRFYLRDLLTEEQAQEIESREVEKMPPVIAAEVGHSEKDLHPLLAYYAHFSLKALTKTIEHFRSPKKEFGEWIHPDMVGCYFPVEDWSPEVVELSSAIGNVGVRIYSFEIKKKLSFGNLREAFFQAVSNSSWAHEGYLVAAAISVDEDFHAELRRLTSAFGIGVISLNTEDPDSSEVLFPAKQRETLDWETIDKLTMNADFKVFLKRVKNDISSKEIRREMYDKVYERDELIRRFKKIKQIRPEPSGP